MLNWILRTSLANRIVVLAAALFVALAGWRAAVTTPIDVLPDLNRPTVTVLTEAHGMVAEDVELLVTWPIEQVLNGATGVYRVRSSSGRGLSVVWAEFEWGTDIYRDRQVVAEKLQLVRADLPRTVRPVMAPISSIMGQIQVIGFQSRSGGTTATELRRIVDRDIVPRVRSLAGVAQVVTIGGQPTELQVIVDADRLRNFDVTLQDVASAVRQANVNVAGGYMKLGAKGPLVTVPGLVRGERELAQAVVRADPLRPIRIEDVAHVAFGPTALRIGDAGIDGRPGVMMIVTKQPGADTLELTGHLGEELNRLTRTLPDDVQVVDEVFQQASFIERAIDNVIHAVRDGALLVVVILFLFLFSLRTTVITLTAIPLSVAVAALVFTSFGLTINTMTLGGLAVAIGTLVDDAIVDVENVYRRLHENAGREEPRPVLSVVYRASSEIRKPVLYGTLLVTVVYLPLFFLSGLEGRLFAPIGIAYIVSVLASLLVALTVTPVLCYYLLGRHQRRRREYGGWVVHHLKRPVAGLIRFSVEHTASIVSVVAAVTVCAAIVLLSKGSSFLPKFNEGSAQVNLILPPDISLDTSEAYGRRLEALLGEIDGIRHVGRRTGRAAGDEHAMPVSVTEAIVTFDPATERGRDDIIEEIRRRLAAELPGVAAATEQPLQHLLDHLLSGVTAQVAIKISGPDLVALREMAHQVENAVRPVPGVRDLFTEPQVLIDQVEVRPKRAQLAALGLSVANVAQTVELAMGGERVSRVPVGQISYPIVVRLEEDDRRDVEDLRRLYLRNAEGSLSLLEDVADVTLAKTPNTIHRENAMRRIVVQHNIGGRSLSDVVQDVERALAPVRSTLAGKPGYSIRISGQFEAQAEATRLILGLSLVSVSLMLLILYLHFRSVRLALVVLLSRPIAFIGAVLWIVLSGQTVSVATLVGFIALLGIAARNAILLVDHYLHLVREEGERLTETMLVRAGRERMVPILMTALTSGIGLVPLALAPDQPGREILYPVATVIIGGLVTSTLLDFLVTPGLFWRFGRADVERAIAARGAGQAAMLTGE